MYCDYLLGWQLLRGRGKGSQFQDKEEEQQEEFEACTVRLLMRM